MGGARHSLPRGFTNIHPNSPPEPLQPFRLASHNLPLSKWISLLTSQVLGDDGRSACQRVLQALHDQHARTLAHHKAVAVLVPGAGRARGLVAALGQGPAVQEGIREFL